MTIPSTTHLFSIDQSLNGLTLYGDLDHDCAGRLAFALRSLECARRRFTIEMSAVTFVDTHGFEPIAESVRRARQMRQPELHLMSVSFAVTRVLDVLGVTLEPFGLHEWDAAGDALTLRVAI